MKISNIIIASVTVFFMACTGSQSDKDHEHSHDGDAAHSHETGGDDHGHDHDADGHHAQESFTVTEDVETSTSDGLAEREDVVDVTVPAKKGVEYKFYLSKYGRLEYEWTAPVTLHSDFHGEPLDYAQTKYFESYVIGNATTMKGLATMPFAGSHGWYWKNETDQDVVVKLKTKGIYKVEGLK